MPSENREGLHRLKRIVPWRLHPYNVPPLRRFYFAALNRCWRCLLNPYHR